MDAAIKGQRVPTANSNSLDDCAMFGVLAAYSEEAGDTGLSQSKVPCQNALILSWMEYPAKPFYRR